MCGIVGFITVDNPSTGHLRKKFMKNALIVDMLRGMDSTGAFIIKKGVWGGSAGYARSTEAGADFVDSANYRKCIEADMATAPFCVGHNRAATRGSVSVDNAHPFIEGTVALVHNGTIRSTQHLPIPMAKLPKDVTVDSHALCVNIAEADEADPSPVTKTIVGGTALVWHDSRSASLNFARNKGRPLHFAMGRGGKTLYFMSEAAQLQFLSSRLDLGFEEIYSLDENVWLQFTEGSLKPRVRTLDMGDDGSSRAYEGYDWRQSSYGYYGFSKAPSRRYEKPSARDEELYVGGRMRPLPQACAHELGGLYLSPSDRLRFKPKSFMPAGNKSLVLGHLPEIALDAVLYLPFNPERLRKDAMSEGSVWSVRPVATKLSPGDKAKDIVAHIVSYCPDPETFRIKDPRCYAKSYQRSNTLRLPAPRGEVAGPGGLAISEDEFYKITEHGCVWCSETLTKANAEDIAWIGAHPVCGPACFHDISEAGVTEADFDEWEAKGMLHPSNSHSREDREEA